jgi:hypothetical protein
MLRLRPIGGAVRRPENDHLELPWRVHEIAGDFELLDVWRFPVRGGPGVPLATFIDFFEEVQGELVSGTSPAGLLFRLRGWLGRVFGWDDPVRPSAVEAAAKGKGKGRPEAAAARVPESSTAESAVPGFVAIYRDEDEALAEIQNATVHALLHLGRVRLDERGGWSPQMAVYVKRRGRLGRIYMAVISPFRHGIVYPAMMRIAARRWPRYIAERRAVEATLEAVRRPGPDAA